MYQPSILSEQPSVVIPLFLALRNQLAEALQSPAGSYGDDSELRAPFFRNAVQLLKEGYRLFGMLQSN
jgi:hypothetical protein